MVFKNVFGQHLGDVTANFIQAALVIFVIGSFFSENPTLLNVFKVGWGSLYFIS